MTRPKKEEGVLVKLEDTMDQLERVADECGGVLTEGAGRFRKAFMVSGAIQRLEALMTDEVMKKVFMPLQGSKLGFITDKDKEGGYPVETVRKCMIEGILRGLWPIGNEMNIIAGNFYCTLNGFGGLIDRREDIQKYEPTIGVMKDGGQGWALIECRARWLHGGEERTIGYDDKDPCTLQIRVNKFMGPDGVAGKAKRKLASRAWERMSTQKVQDADVEEIREAEAVIVDEKRKPKTERLKEELQAEVKEKTFAIHLSGPALEAFEGPLASLGFKPSFEGEGVFKTGLSLKNHPEIVKLVLVAKDEDGRTVSSAIDAEKLALEVYEE